MKENKACLISIQLGTHEIQKSTFYVGNKLTSRGHGSLKVLSRPCLQNSKYILFGGILKDTVCLYSFTGLQSYALLKFESFFLKEYVDIHYSQSLANHNFAAL